MTKILYPQENGRVAIVHPTANISIQDACERLVPAGTPYLLVEDDVIPSDRSFRNAWEADFSNPDGHGIGEEAYFAAKAAEAQQ